MDLTIDDVPDKESPDKGSPNHSDRTNLSMPSSRLALEFPSVFKLMKLSLQKLRLDRTMHQLKPAALGELVSMVGGGILETRLMGRNIDLSVGFNTKVVAAPGFEDLVADVHKAPWAVLEKAKKDGKAITTKAADFSIVFPAEPQDDLDWGDLITEWAPNQDISLGSREFKRLAPNLHSLAYCQIQKNHLGKKIKALNKEAKKELAGLENTNIHTEFNNQEVMISTFARETSTINPSCEDEIQAMREAQMSIPEKLGLLVDAGKAKFKNVYFLAAKTKK